ncbi:sensor histidine kinase [Kitasatospora sp. NPDC054939]
MRRVGRSPEWGLPAVASAAAAAGVVSLWWGLFAMAAAFLAGWRLGRARAAVAVFAGLVAVGVLAALVVPEWIALGTKFVVLVVCTAMGPWLLGRFLRLSRELVRAGWERAEHLEREQRWVAEQARLRERARIARDMHDALGHDLSLIALRAGALKLAPGLAAPHREAAQEIRAGAAAAVERLGEVIGVLRDEPDEADGTDGTDGFDTAGSGPADADVPQLVAEAGAAGLDVRLRVTGEPDGLLPRAVEHAAYRVVQEALTNAAKYAPRARVDVGLAYGPDGVRVRVANEPTNEPSGERGRGPSGEPSGDPGGGRGRTGGRGLLGLAERARLTGGTCTHGPTPDGGFEVVARLPCSRPAAHPVTQAAGGHPAHPARPVAVETRALHRARRRRVGRTLAAVLLVPLATAVVLTVVLRGWLLYETGRSVLDPVGYASLRVGQERAAVEHVLPDRRLPRRGPVGPVGPGEGEGEGLVCEYYAIAAELFVDRSGDAYRLCFRDGRLVSKDMLVG